MHVLIISPRFPPEPVTCALTNQHLAEGLVQSGHQVTVITAFPSRPAGRLYNGYCHRFRTVEHCGGYKVIRCFSTLAGKTTGYIENFSFGVSSILNSLNIKADIVYANTWPFVSSGLISALCAWSGLPLVLNIQDIYPETAVNLGMLADRGMITRILRYLDSRIACSAAGLITISENFSNFYKYARGVPDHKVHIVYNWMDGDVIKVGPRYGNFRKGNSISEEKFVILYAGNVGAVADVETIIESMAVLREQSRNFEKIMLIIAGDGSHRSDCEDLAHQYNLTNVQFFYPLRLEQVSEVQEAADVLVLPTRRSGSFSSVPSKLIAYMLSGRPILGGVEDGSDTAMILREAQCGVIVEPEDPGAMAAEFERLMERPEDLARMGVKARSYAEEHFTRNSCVPKVVGLLERLYQVNQI